MATKFKVDSRKLTQKKIDNKIEKSQKKQYYATYVPVRLACNTLLIIHRNIFKYGQA